MSLKFQDVVDAHYKNLYHFALSLCRSPDSAWDLTQEAFLIWARKGSTLRSSGAVKSWLYTTLYREFLKTAKRSSRFVSIDDSDEAVNTPLLEETEPDNLDANNVMQLLAELKIEYRKVVTLYYMESYSYKEIASILDIPIGTVMSRLARGKGLLKRKLKQADSADNIVKFSKKTKKGTAHYG